ncbi:MAG: hypothetical protein J6P13_01595 [Kiritimatiellae bacterium]|nr:hypothetical protein [Kiritimatiellia bacterium]
MKPIEILSAVPQWAHKTSRELLMSPAWSMPCRFGEKQCVLRKEETRLAETFDLKVSFGGKANILSLAPSPAFKELGAVWQSRAAVPSPILLALVEKDCAGLFQLLENAVREELKVEGLATPEETEAISPREERVFFKLEEASGALCVFALKGSDDICEAFGALRNIDPANDAVRETRLDAEVQYAAFVLKEDEMASLAPGDALLLPEVGSLQSVYIIEGTLAANSDGVAAWEDDGILRVVSAEKVKLSLGAVLDGLPAAPRPVENAQLRLVKSGTILASGHFGSVSAHPAFICE